MADYNQKDGATLPASIKSQTDSKGADGAAIVTSPGSMKTSTSQLLPRQSGTQDPETATGQQKKLKYPKSVFFIVTNEFCERFSFYGMRAVLTLYMSFYLGFSADTSTVLYHLFIVLCYFTPIFGAMLADSLLGKFRTIFYISIIYAIGNCTLSLAAAPPTGLPVVPFSMLGLILIAIGTGGIKPCVSAFGGDQFILPQQERQLQQFFSVFYFSINSGSLISTFVTPVLRQDVSCFGDSTCYPLAFGVPALLMIVSLAIFLFGKRLYIMNPPKGNLLLEVCKCVGHGISRRVSSCVSSGGEKHDHWLDYAGDKYDQKLITEIKSVFKVLFLYIPIPLFWALFEQQGSRWTFQAVHMKGETFGYNLKPDQMQVINPLLVLAMIPFVDSVMYPLCARIGVLTRPLQKMAVGGILAGIAFVVSGLLELQLEKTYAVLPGVGQSQLTFINTLPCNVTIRHPFDPNGGEREDELRRLDKLVFSSIEANNRTQYDIDLTLDDSCLGLKVNQKTWSGKVTAYEKQVHSVVVAVINGDLHAEQLGRPDYIDKSVDGMPFLQIIYNFDSQSAHSNSCIYVSKGGKNAVTFEVGGSGIGATPNKTLDGGSGNYQAYLLKNCKEDNSSLNVPDAEFSVALGGVYSLVLQKNADTGLPQSSQLHVITPPNSIHMLWLIPQYLLITFAEVMFSITGLEFSFTQSPLRMKSVLQAAWLLTSAFGNIIVIVVAEARAFEKQSQEFFLFAGLMFADMIVFIIMAVCYKYVDADTFKEEPPVQENGIEIMEKKPIKNGIHHKDTTM